MEETDKSIRQALEDLPEDLTTTFRRILERSRPKSHNSYQRTILGLLLASIRPLTLQELGEALSVVPADPTWDPRRRVNNIHHVLSSCGSLIVVTEEERTVQFVHQSVVQFLLEQKSAPDWNFTQLETNLHLGEVCVTYLSYNVFTQHLSTAVVPVVPTAESPVTVTRNTLANAGLPQHLARVFIKAQRKSGTNIGRTLLETDRSRGQSHIPETFHFLKYASSYWLRHTSNIERSCVIFQLWEALLLSRFGDDGIVWTPDRVNPEKICMGDGSNIFSMPARATWAIIHSHHPLLSAELRARNGLKTLCSIVPSLRLWSRAGYALKLDSPTCTRLLQISILFRAEDVAQYLLDACIDQGAFERDSLLKYADEIGGFEPIRWMISLDDFGSLKTCRFPILERACRARDTRTLAVAIAAEADFNLYDRRHPFDIAFDVMQEGKDSTLATCIFEATCLGQTAIEGQEKLDRLYWYLRYYETYYNDDLFNHCVAVWKSDFSAPFLTDQLLHRACSNGELNIVKGLLRARAVYHSTIGVSEESMTSWMTAALHSRSEDRAEIVWDLLESVASNHPSISSHVFMRCIQLRAWELAKRILSFNDHDWRINRSDTRLQLLITATRRSQLLHLCAACGDHAGLELLMRELPMETVHEFLRTPGFGDLKDYTPLQLSLFSLTDQHPISEEAICSMQAVSTILGSTGQHDPAVCGETPNSCLELIPSFLAITIQSMVYQNEDLSPFLKPNNGPMSSDGGFRLQYSEALETFVELWVAHVGPKHSPNQQLLDMWRHILQGVHGLRARILKNQPPEEPSTDYNLIAGRTRDGLLLLGKTELARDYIEIATVLLGRISMDCVRSRGLEPVANLLTDQVATWGDDILGFLAVFDDLTNDVEMAQLRPTCTWTLAKPVPGHRARPTLSDFIPSIPYATIGYDVASGQADRHFVPVFNTPFDQSRANRQELPCDRLRPESNQQSLANTEDTHVELRSDPDGDLHNVSSLSDANEEGASHGVQESFTQAEDLCQQAMQATVIQTLGPPTVLTQVLLPKPVAPPGEILIRVRAFAISSIYMHRCKWDKDQWSPIMMQECVGTVEEHVPLGPNATELKLASGSKVAAAIGNLDHFRSGSYGEFVSVPICNAVSLDTALP